jgi:hypothetical protein
MRFLVLLSIVSLFFQNQPKRLIIDISQVYQLELSSIATKVIPIPLKTSKFSFTNIEKVFLINDNIIYVLNISEINGTLFSQVLKFDLGGNLLAQIGEKDQKSHEFLRVYDMKFDKVTSLLHLVYSDCNRVYDVDGNLKNLYKREDKSPGFRTVHEIVHKGKIWRSEIYYRDGLAFYDIVQSDLNGQNLNKLKTFKFKISRSDLKSGTERYDRVHFSIHENEMYLSCGVDNTIYKIINNKLIPEYIVEFRNQAQPTDYFYSASKQVIIGRYIINEYTYNWMQYDFIYDCETSKTYNMKFHPKIGIISSGIIDDLFYTGSFDLNQTNLEDYIYFTKKTEEIRGINIYDPKQAKTIIFLVKLN